MQIIDMEAHYGPMDSAVRSFYTAKDLYAYMDTYGIQGVAAYHREALRDAETGNRKILELSVNNDRIYPVYVIDPPIESAYLKDQDTLMRILSCGASAVRLFPNNTHWQLHPLYVGEIFSVFEEMQMPVLLEYGQCDLALLPQVLEAFPKLRLVLLRFGLRQSRYIYPILKKYENVRFGTGFMADVEILDDYVNRYGAERFLFSAGIPQYDPCGAIAMVLGLSISDTEKEKIFSTNFLSMVSEIRKV